MSRRPYFKFYFEDFLNGVRKANLTPEEVGMYVMTLGFIWQDEGATAGDPSLIGVRTGWGKRLSRRLVSQLIEKKKLVETDDGRLTNARMENEIVAFVALKQAAQAREAARRKSHYSQTIDPLESDYKRTPTNLFSKKCNKINETTSTDPAHTRIQNPESRPVCETRTGARAGEEDVGFDVYVNCRTVRHENFEINLDAIERLVNGEVPKDEVKNSAIGHGLQWATDIANGKPVRDVVPDNIANFIARAVRGSRRRPNTKNGAPKVHNKTYWQDLAELSGETGDVR